MDESGIKSLVHVLDLVHSRGKALAKDVDFEKIARRTPGFTGADLQNLMNEAAILAARRDLKEISKDDISDALERIIVGREKKNVIVSDEKKRLVAYHEVGHALVGALMPECDPVAKISIIPRGQAGGLTFFAPSEERLESGLYSRSYLENQMAVALGGRQEGRAVELVHPDNILSRFHVADMHFGNGKLTPCRDVLDSEFGMCSDLNTTLFLERMIQLEKPDFVAFTGDNIFGSTANDAAESLFQAFGPVMKSGIPWAAILGNHDQESTMTREELMSFISLMDFSLSQTFPSDEDNSDPDKQDSVPNIDGFGNYNLRVWGAPGSNFLNNTVLNLYFLDSGDRAVVDGVRTYDWIKESQLNWLRNVSQKLQEQKLNCGESSPSLAFFHIPIPEIRQGPLHNLVGRYREYAACSLVNSGVLKTLVSVGDVKAVFIGHDHTNDFCGILGGIWFCYGGGFGYHGYGVAGWSRRGRVILAELRKGDQSWGGVERIRTWKRLDDETLSKIDEQVLWER